VKLYDSLLTLSGFPRGKDVMFVKAQNVADYVYIERPEGNFEMKDFPNVAPLADHIWFEWRAPKVFRIGDKFIPAAGPGIKHGCMVDSTRKPAEDGGGWESRGVIFSLVLEERRLCQHGIVEWKVSRTGELLRYAPGGKRYTILGDKIGDGMDQLSVLDTLMWPCWMALSLMHCKNVRVEKDPAPPAALCAARARKGKPPVHRWHTVIVDPNKTTRKGESSGGELFGMNPLHICRGHFKTFTAEKPLFGNRVGMYWWAMHTRGSEANGVVEKDYVVKP